MISLLLCRCEHCLPCCGWNLPGRWRSLSPRDRVSIQLQLPHTLCPREICCHGNHSCLQWLSSRWIKSYYRPWTESLDITESCASVLSIICACLVINSVMFYMFLLIFRLLLCECYHHPHRLSCGSLLPQKHWIRPSLPLSTRNILQPDRWGLVQMRLELH